MTETSAATSPAASSAVADLRDWRRLLDDPPDPEITEKGRLLKEAAMLDFGVRESAIASWLYTKCHRQIPTLALETAAVVATGDGSCVLLYNPEFFAAIGADGVRFVLFHEARHLIHRHLYVEAELRADPVFTVAAEVSINHVAMRRLRAKLPTRPADGGVREPVGVDPYAIHAGYEEDLRARGLEPLAYEQFVETDMTVYGELKRMSDPPVPSGPVCPHLAVGGVPLDEETVGLVVEGVLADVLRAALRGEGPAHEEILLLADRTEGGGERVARLWGRLGLGALRGRTEPTRRVEWWKRWLADTLASKLRDGERLVYPRKHGAVLLALGHEPMLSRRGRERTKVVVVAIDTSASMPRRVIDWLVTLIGRTDGVETHWLSFDGEVMPFVAGERVRGGGGTDFGKVVEYVEGRREAGGRRCEAEPDAVIMVTDGYAPQVTPARPEHWIWLITDGGDDWPERHSPPMACHRVTTGDS
ncbi:hypothetical protein OG875_14770 [Streptomyces sp. NBC_01498]|uniref:DUF2201 family putative metallopeptidase n=1 Tax=Streptomyces sp. NBC_01498 TaxID=2975870 RepID=UPI002E7C0F46|nr:hypothetical protein [Streptomyces sp. NBC_01498]WTL25750.1 hypothetical protein OG875_14770 [Streptomyces sp. NBC_01498]